MKLLLTLLISTLAAWAGDLTGNWKATAEGPNGSIERTFQFKVDGNKLTGETTSSFLGKSAITDGKVDGDSFSFTINVKLQDNDTKINYKGKVNGDQIKLTSEFGDRTIEWTGKKVN